MRGGLSLLLKWLKKLSFVGLDGRITQQNNNNSEFIFSHRKRPGNASEKLALCLRNASLASSEALISPGSALITGLGGCGGVWLSALPGNASKCHKRDFINFF